MTWWRRRRVEVLEQETWVCWRSEVGQIAEQRQKTDSKQALTDDKSVLLKRTYSVLQTFLKDE
jgi:hypothetical protein